MEIRELVDRFHAVIGTGQVPAWEAQEYVEPLTGLPEAVQQAVLDRLAVVWPVSHYLAASYLELAGPAFTCLAPEDRGPWLALALEAYERGGIQEAYRFMADVQGRFLCRLRGEDGLRLAQVLQRLAVFLDGVSGGGIELREGEGAWTDGMTIHLPATLTLFPGRDENLACYRFLLLAQYRLLAEGDLARLVAAAGGLLAQPMARDLARILALYRSRQWLAHRFPGLAGDLAPLLSRCARPPATTAGDQATACAWLATAVLDPHRPLPPEMQGVTGALAEDAARGPLPVRLLEVVSLLEPPPAGPWSLPGEVLFGELRLDRARQGLRHRQEADGGRFAQALALLLARQDTATRQQLAGALAGAGGTGDESGVVMVMAGEGQGREEGGVALQIGGMALDLDQETALLAARLAANNQGRLPQRYVAGAVGIGGAGTPSVATPAPPEPAAEEENNGAGLRLSYDEWDYRRQGYRRDWCHLYLRQVPEVGGDFVARTFHRHRGLVTRLRRQFEELRLDNGRQRRQPEGDCIDLAAVVDHRAERRAGAAADPRPYIRLERNQRRVAAGFLVDMSSSTEGWILTAMKEALLLMGEALDVLGDRFFIAGFSGMRRLRADYYQVKDLDEPFGPAVKNRIAGIMAREYTRMGPAIRHASSILARTDAAVRLLVVLSDGKPEDYDDYKGEYAIEDTRHALIEARTQGVHPFCITVDRQAPAYLPHMYGEVNYVCIDGLHQLPARIPAIYRRLTF